MLAFHLRVAVGQDVDLAADMVDLQQPRLDPVVEVGGEIRNLVGQVDDLDRKSVV